MGEVYKAEDIKLSLNVALKFLPDDFRTGSAALERLHSTVRHARQISQIFTGNEVFSADSIPELIRKQTSETPTNPSEFVKGIDPLVELAISHFRQLHRPRHPVWNNGVCRIQLHRRGEVVWR
jgi:hypothetical protein